MNHLSLKKVLVFMCVTLFTATTPFLTVVLTLWYKAVTLLAVKIKKFEGPVSGISTFFTPDNIFERPNATLIHLAVLNGTPDISKIAREIFGMYESRNQDNSRMYDKLAFTIVHWMGYVFWKKAKDFEIESRIHFVHDPSVNSENIGRFVESIIRKPFVPDEPLWEIYLVSKADFNRNGTSNNLCYVVFRTHHILLDGLSIVKLWYKADGQSELPEVIKYKAFAIRPKNDNGIIRNFVSDWKQFWHEQKMFWICPYKANKTLSIPQDSNCITEQYKDFSKDWFCSGVHKVHIDAYRESLRELEFTITHAVIVGYTRGFRRFVETHYGLNSVPRKIHILGSIPVPNHPDNVLTNHWSVMRYKAELNTSSILEELEKAKTEYSRAVNDIAPQIFSFMIDTARGLPGDFFEGIMETRNSGTLSLSNIPGPKREQKMFGIDAVDRMIWLPLSRNNSGIALQFLTYKGWGNFTMTADSEVISDRKLFDDLNLFVEKEMQIVLDEVSRLAEIKKHFNQSEDLTDVIAV